MALRSPPRRSSLPGLGGGINGKQPAVAQGYTPTATISRRGLAGRQYQTGLSAGVEDETPPAPKVVGGIPPLFARAGQTAYDPFRPEVHPGNFTPQGQAANRQSRAMTSEQGLADSKYAGMQQQRAGEYVKRMQTYDSMGRPSQTQAGLRGQANGIIAGGQAPPSRAQTPFLSASQSRLLGGPVGSVNGKGGQVNGQIGQQPTPLDDRVRGVPEITTNERGAQVFGIPGRNGGPSKYYSGSKAVPGTEMKGVGGRSLALIGTPRAPGQSPVNTLMNEKDGTPNKAYERAAARKQEDRDTRLLTNVQRFGLPMGTPKVQAALGRMQAGIDAAESSKAATSKHNATLDALDEEEMKHHLAHAATLPPLRAAEYIAALRASKVKQLGSGRRVPLSLGLPREPAENPMTDIGVRNIEQPWRMQWESRL